MEPYILAKIKTNQGIVNHLRFGTENIKNSLLTIFQYLSENEKEIEVVEIKIKKVKEDYFTTSLPLPENIKELYQNEKITN